MTWHNESKKQCVSVPKWKLYITSKGDRSAPRLNVISMRNLLGSSKGTCNMWWMNQTHKSFSFWIRNTIHEFMVMKRVWYGFWGWGHKRQLEWTWIWGRTMRVACKVRRLYDPKHFDFVNNISITHFNRPIKEFKECSSPFP